MEERFNHFKRGDTKARYFIEEEKAETSSIKEDVERLQQQLYEATSMNDEIKNKMLEDRVINLIRGESLSLQSYTRIRNVLNQCVVSEDNGNNEYPSKELVDNFIKKFYNHFGMVEPEETDLDFIKEREMDIF
jgi:hypothetical protein